MPTRDFLSKNSHKEEQKQEESTYDDVILEHARSYKNHSSDKGLASNYHSKYKFEYDEEFYKKKGIKGLFIKIVLAVPIIVLGVFFFSKSPLLESVVNLFENSHSNTGDATRANSVVHKEKETIVQETPVTLDVSANEKLLGNQRNSSSASSRLNELVSIENNGKDERAVTVGKGDTFAKLLFSEYGEYNEGIIAFVLEANPEITDVNRIFVGQRIRLPKR